MDPNDGIRTQEIVQRFHRFVDKYQDRGTAGMDRAIEQSKRSILNRLEKDCDRLRNLAASYLRQLDQGITYLLRESTIFNLTYSMTFDKNRIQCIVVLRPTRF